MLEAEPTTIPSARLAALTPRELEVLELTSGGLTNAMAATRLGMTVHSVKFHLASIFKKLGVTNRTEAAAFYFRGYADTQERAADGRTI